MFIITLSAVKKSFFAICFPFFTGLFNHSISRGYAALKFSRISGQKAVRLQVLKASSDLLQKLTICYNTGAVR